MRAGRAVDRRHLPDRHRRGLCGHRPDVAHHRRAEYYVAGRRVPAVYNGSMATAADWMSAASSSGTAGVLYLQGFAGLAYILGWTGGYCLVALLLAPYLRRLGCFTIPEFLGRALWRHLASAGRGVIAVTLVSFVYVVVQIYGVGLITSHLTGFSFEIGIFVGLGGVLVCLPGRHARSPGPRWRSTSC